MFRTVVLSLSRSQGRMRSSFFSAPHRRRVGRGAPHDHGDLNDRVRARAPRQQSKRRVLVPEWERRGSNRTQPAVVRALQGRGRESALRRRLSSPVHLPAYIYPVEPRKEPTFGYRLLRAICSAFRVLFPNQVIPADDLARSMVDVVVARTNEREQLVFENRDIRAMARHAK